ncbi:MAG TPA: alpha/beta hydrolase [Chitinophagaceae bacterium]
MNPVLLLHGATGSAGQFDDLKKQLSKDMTVYTMDFYGHGKDPEVDKSFSIEGFAEQVSSFINGLQLKQAINIFGYSMGGYVAMYMARHSGHSGKIITLGTKFHWDEATASKESKMLQPNLIEQKVPAFARQLSERHGNERWKNLLNKTAAMLTEMGQTNPLSAEDFANIQSPSLIMLGDRDKMVSLNETVSVYQTLPDAQLAILPGTSHPVEQADSSLIAYHIRRFIG